MSLSKLIAFCVIIFPRLLLGAEPSAFGAGDLNNPNPYGLSSTEKVILETKQNLNKIVVKSNNQANEVESLRERIDGLQTVIESINATAHGNKLSIKSLTENNELKHKTDIEHDKRVDAAIKQNSDTISINAKDIEKILLQIAEISKIVDSINSSYVSKEEFNSLITDVNSFKDLVAKQLKEINVPKSSSSETMSNADVEKKAKSLYDSKKYKESAEYYKQLIAKNYKPARAHYMVGEAYYYMKNYAEAIAYFKKSASLYSKADYMPVLLLHTAISMDETKDLKNAKSFYEAVIAQFPKSNSANIAKKKLDSLK